jgi:ABC-type sugar transport system ATPase subunit
MFVLCCIKFLAIGGFLSSMNAQLMESIRAENVVKSFGQTKALNGVTLEILPGELFFLLGASG